MTTGDSEFLDNRFTEFTIWMGEFGELLRDLDEILDHYYYSSQLDWDIFH